MLKVMQNYYSPVATDMDSCNGKPWYADDHKQELEKYYKKSFNDITDDEVDEYYEKWFSGKL